MSADVHAAAHASKHQGFGAPAETVNKIGLLRVEGTHTLLLPLISFSCYGFKLIQYVVCVQVNLKESQLLESDHKNIFTPPLKKKQYNSYT